MDSSFFSSEQATDPSYNHIRDNPIRKEASDFVEGMWQKYASYAEPQFLDKAREDFHAKIWEMYIGCLFLDYGFDLQKKIKEKGPDICLSIENRNLWIEAVAPTSGTGDNAIPDIKAGDVPVDKILLRLRGAIKEKYNQYKGYRNRGIIKPDDYYVIAVNGGRITYGLLDENIPYIVKCVLPFGHPVLDIDTTDKTSLKIVGSYHEYRDTIATHKGSPVHTNIFENKEYSKISAILYSWMNVVDRPTPIGVEIQYVHNPLADKENKLPLGIFPFGTEWYVENDDLIRKGRNKN